MSDEKFRSLQQKWRNCISQSGYTLESIHDGGGVHFEQSWSEEQTQQAFLTEAQCADDMSYTQQVADINAAYQMQYIRQHEAELVQIKRTADDRVTMAIQVLRDAGIM
jgi:hypothetical protein